MIYLSMTQSKAVVVNLYDLSTNLVNPYFTWKFINDSTNRQVIAYADDNSYAPYYWNRFTFSIVVGTAGLTQGQVNLTSGEWKYEVYQMSNKYDLDLSNAITMVETGICIVGSSYSQIMGTAIGGYHILGL